MSLPHLTDPLPREGQAWVEAAPGQEPSHLQELLAPFQAGGPRLSVQEGREGRVDVGRVRSTVDSPVLWDQGISHTSWLTSLVTTLLGCFAEHTVPHHLSAVCRLDTALCRTLLPFIIQELLLVNCSDIRLILSKKICDFFRDHFRSVAEGVPGSPAAAHTRRESVAAVLEVVTHLRAQPLPPHLARENNCWENNFWLANLNYLHCARAALTCGAPAAALLLASVWCFQREREATTAAPLGRGGSLLERVGVSEEGEAVQAVIHTASLLLGDRDAALGAGTVDLASPAARSSSLAMAGNFGLALPLADAQVAAGGGREALVAALYTAGLHHTLGRYLGAGAGAGEVQGASEGASRREQEVQQECSWRLQQWDRLSPDTAAASVPGCVLGALEGAVRGDGGAVAYWRRTGEGLVRARLREEQVETVCALHPLLTELRQLGELGRLGGGDVGCLGMLMARDEGRAGEFAWVEPVLSQRQVLVAAGRGRGEVLEELVLHTSRLARRAGVAWVCGAQQRLGLAPSLALRWEEALVAWGQGQHRTATALARRLLGEVEGGEGAALLPQVLLRLGKWLHQERTETSRTILDTFLTRAVTLLEERGDQGEQVVGAHLALAQFADLQYKQLQDYLASPEFQERQEGAARIAQEATTLKPSIKDDKAISTSVTIKDRFSKKDLEEGEEQRAEAAKYLGLALRHYLAVLALAAGRRAQAAVYRLVALWFAAADSPVVRGLLPEALPGIASHRFIPLLYQLAARMEVPKAGVKDSPSALYALMLRCTSDHPHHALPIILALTNAKQDEKELGSKAATTTDSRGIAASKIVATIKKSGEGSRVVVERYTALSLGLINLAYVTAPGKVTDKVAFPKGQALLQVKDWGEVAVPTDTLAVRPDRDYGGVAGVARFLPHYSMVGGINAPKKISCLGTDGRLRLQLVKGKDDLRQDAVMEQVFGLLNQLLEQDEEARRHKLSIRTYKVVPLSQRSGVLEWCTDTQPLALYLVGAGCRGGAHRRYFPRQWDSHACRTRMSAAAVRGRTTAADREKVYREVCANFSPVMKYFFLEKFATASAYYLARTRYTKSAATNSMVGHVLGLGDRHTNNILVDNSTGEMIHIDLGVAFEQGKILPTPEKIPFRLSRDVVDGFGPAGVEGVFRCSVLHLSTSPLYLTSPLNYPGTSCPHL